MGFLYGDSTPSPLESNFLEFLRDALDFSVVLLRADENIRALHRRRAADARSADEQIARLEAFGGVVTTSIQEAAGGDDGSETSRCAAHLVKATADAVAVSLEAVRADLAARVAHADSEEAAEREACFKALDGLLLPHAPPEARVVTHLERTPAGPLQGSVKGEATFGLGWQTELAIPEGHPFASALPIERLTPQLEISAPAAAGWLKKELKMRPQRLERFALTDVTDDGERVGLKLRADVGSDQGFDFEVNPRDGAVSATRTTKEAGVDGAFDVSAEDAAKLVSLAEKVRSAIAEIKGGRLVEATFGEGDFRAHPAFEDVVERLVGLIAPIVKEIARHSLTPTELVIRRLLSNERREEIFVTKAALHEKVAHLPATQRMLFDSLGLVPAAVSLTPEPLPSDPPDIRSEVARSEPPPPRRSSRPSSGAEVDIGMPPPLPKIPSS